MKSVALCYSFYDHLRSHDPVRSGECVVGFKNNLMLTARHLVMRRLNDIAHLAECKTNIPSNILSVIGGGNVKIAALVVGLGRGFTVLVGVKQEKLKLRTYLEGVAKLL